MHQPVLLDEILAALAVRPAGVSLDGTFGRGGHSRATPARLGPSGRLVALDRDPDAEGVARQLADKSFSFFRTAFSSLSKVLETVRIPPLNGMVFDLGVSSPQLDDPERGLSFRSAGPLDMPLDPQAGPSAAEWLATAGEKQIREVIRDYGEERLAKQIAAA